MIANTQYGKLLSFLFAMALITPPIYAQLADTPIAKPNKSEIRIGQFKAVFDRYAPRATYPEMVTAMIGKEEGAKLTAFFAQPANKGRSQYSVRLADESFEVYVPASYSTDKPAGLIVYISPQDKVTIPTSWQRIFDVHNIIFVAANKSGNDQSPIDRRVPLALHALENITANYSIDGQRIYAAGFSGGAKVAGYLGVSYGDIFRGALYICGSKPIGKGEVVLPMTAAQQVMTTNRYVFLTGRKDFNRDEIKKHSKNYQTAKIAKITLIDDPSLGHEEPNGSLFEKALNALDNRI